AATTAKTTVVGEATAPKATVPLPNNGLKLHKIGHTTNIFDLCHPDSSKGLQLSGVRDETRRSRDHWALHWHEAPSE
ncbi:hypothetical protein PENTCL1PPCAC_24235, partial [Pristionchus entomophagus]